MCVSFRVWDSRFRGHIEQLVGSWVCEMSFGVEGFRARVEDLELRVYGVGFRI